MIRPSRLLFAAFALLLVLTAGCIFSKVPVKQYYMMNYLPSTSGERINPAPWPCTIRLRDFGIEEAYNRPQIVYRQSPFELQYYVYRVWAVKPTRMITDLVYKHLLSRALVSGVTRRFDEGAKPDFELSGQIEALEEYDSEQLWFAHIAIRMHLVRVSDGQSMYTRRFDLRKRVYQHNPENVIKELSSLIEYIMTQTAHDLDVRFAREYGYNAAAPSAPETAPAAPPAPAPEQGPAASPDGVEGEQQPVLDSIQEIR